MSEAKLCYWCHEPLPLLPEDATYVDEINHYMHEHCREGRDDGNRRTEELRAGIADGTIDCIPQAVRRFVLERIERLGFARRCPCLYDPAHGFTGHDPPSSDEEDPDVTNSIDGCELCGGTGKYDPLPKLVALTDDQAAERWVVHELPKSAGSCDHWTGFPEEGWYYDALGYNRHGKGAVRGVALYNPNRMLGGVITWAEIADLFRPRMQSSLF